MNATASIGQSNRPVRISFTATDTFAIGTADDGGAERQPGRNAASAGTIPPRNTGRNMNCASL